MAIGTGRWFRRTRDLLAAELGWMIPAPDYPFLPKWEEAHIRMGLRCALHHLMRQGDGYPIERQIRQRDRERRIRERRVALRWQIAEMKRSGRLARKPSPFDTFYGDAREEALALNVEELLPRGRALQEVLAELMSGERAYPYLELWIKGTLFLVYYAGAHGNEAIGENDGWDLELLLTAKDLDIVVSEDTRFMRTAFHHLFGTSKEYLSLDEFLARLN